jgi:hypothetical protein
MTRDDEEAAVDNFRRHYEATPEDPAAAARARRALARGTPPVGRWVALSTLVAAGLVTLVVRSGPRTAPPVADSLVTVHFVLVSQARQVSVVGDFNGWDPAATPMSQGVPNSLWQASARVGAGRVEYAFVLDGRTWIPDPNAPLAPESDFGTRNSVLTAHTPGAL